MTEEAVTDPLHLTEKKSVQAVNVPTTETKPTWIIWSAASYAIVMIIIGLPLWWKTTAVQRAPLPYHEMFDMHEKFETEFKVTVTVNLVGFSSSNRQEIEANFEPMVSFQFKETSGNSLDVLYKSSDFYEIDKEMCKYDSKSRNASTYQLQIFFVGRADFFKAYGETFFIGNCKSAYYISNSSKLKINKMKEILDIITYVDKKKEFSVVSKAENSNRDFLQLPLSNGYDVLLTLMVPQPEILDARWSIEEGTKKFFKPLLRKLFPYAEMTVRSQVLYYIRLNLRPMWNQNIKAYRVSYNQLPLVINPVELKLTSYVSQNPVLNFIVYTVPCDQHPMRIIDENGSQLDSNAFLVPQWGGIFLYNVACNYSVNYSKKTTQTAVISNDAIASVFLSQFRSLIGLPPMSKNKQVLDFRSVAIRDWEVDSLVRKRLKDLVSTATNTLKSLGQLLGQITNIVVTKEVGEEVEKSVTSLRLAFKYAEEGNVHKAQEEALKAFVASEVAFHHPTNLAQLYFPDDQKYAIYIPLFLPVGIPVILSLRLLFSHVAKKFKKVKKD